MENIVTNNDEASDGQLEQRKSARAKGERHPSILNCEFQSIHLEWPPTPRFVQAGNAATRHDTTINTRTRARHTSLPSVVRTGRMMARIRACADTPPLRTGCDGAVPSQ